jgi:hypothetical protein
VQPPLCVVFMQPLVCVCGLATVCLLVLSVVSLGPGLQPSCNLTYERYWNDHIQVIEDPNSLPYSDHHIWVAIQSWFLESICWRYLKLWGACRSILQRELSWAVVDRLHYSR